MGTIGIGVTTYRRPEMLNKCLEYIKKYSKAGYKLHIADDTFDRRGVAYRKNECLRALKDCDYIFLFDDDCYPINEGWEDLFIKSGEHHLLFLHPSHQRTIVRGGIEHYNNCGGVFMFLTQQAVNLVGAFNEMYELWGLEHADYSQRIHYSGITPAPYMHLKKTDKYLYSEDYSNPKHKSSINNSEKNRLFKLNFPKFVNRSQTVKIPL